MNQQKASRRRAASRWIGYGGVIACAIAAAVWYIVHILVNEEKFEGLEIAGVKTLPRDLWLIAGVAVVLIVIAIVVRVRAAHYAHLSRDEELTDGLDDEDEDDGVYREEPLEPIAPAEEPAALAAPAEEAVAVSEPAPEPAKDKVIASFEVRVPSNPAKEAKKAEKRAKRDEKTSKVKATVEKTVGKAFPPEKREELKKKMEAAKKAAKIIVPVAVACIVVAKVAKKRKKKKHEKEKARNRQQFYQWLG